MSSAEIRLPIAGSSLSMGTADMMQFRNDAFCIFVEGLFGVWGGPVVRVLVCRGLMYFLSSAGMACAESFWCPGGLRDAFHVPV